MRFSSKIIAALLAFVLVLGVVPYSAAAADNYADVPATHWAHDVIAKWSGDGYGILEGDGTGNFLPSKGLTLGELAAILSNAFGYTNRTEADVTPAWSDEFVEKAMAAGVIDEAEKVDASVSVTREEAILYIARAYHIAPLDDETTFADNSQIGAAYKPYVSAFQQAGYVAGKGNNSFEPNAVYTRAEAMQVLENTTSDIIDTSVKDKEYTGNVIIRKAGVVLENAVVSGDLIIGQGVADGDVHFNNVTVKGDVFVSGGGVNSLYMANFRVEGSMIVRKYEGEATVRIVVSGESNFSAVVLETGAILVTQQLADGTKIPVEIPAGYLAGSKFEFIGNFDTIVNNGSNTNITVTGTVNTLTLNGSAAVSGTGKIATAIVAADAGEDTTFATKPTSVTGGGKDDATLPSAPSSGGGGGGGGGGGTRPPAAADKIVVSAALTQNAVTVNQGDSYTLPATVTAILDNNTTHDFAIVWSPATAGTANAGTFTFTGTLTMETGYKNPNNVAVTLTLTVKPVLTGITVTPPAQVLYIAGDELDLTGMTVTGTYSDGSEAVIGSSDYTVSGYNAAQTGEQTITVTANGKTAAFTVTVYERITGGTLAGITDPDRITVANGAEKSTDGLKLPKYVEIRVANESELTVGEYVYSNTLADVEWNLENIGYDPDVKAEQMFEVTGGVTLPDGIDDGGVALETKASVTVSAAIYTVLFDLNGQTGAAIPQQIIEHGTKVTEPATPASISSDFIGWYRNAEGDGDVWNFGSDTVEGNITLYAKWKIKSYTITFAQGMPETPVSANLPAALSVDHGTAGAKPSDPALEGYGFAGWFTDKACTSAYNWSAPVTGSVTLYAKFTDSLSAAADALTFDLIKAGNANEMSIMTNLALITSMTDYPGITISWASDPAGFISETGAVTRPGENEADAVVTLTATLQSGTASVEKEFTVVVNKQGTSGVEVKDKDERFATGYPLVAIDENGVATLMVKLKPGIATDENPVVAYYAMDGWNASEYWTFNKESILAGHLVDADDEYGETAVAGGPYAEIVITDDREYIVDSGGPLMQSGNPVAIGIVLLADDKLDDRLAVGTVIQLTAEEANYVDSEAPNAQAAVFNIAGNKIYAYFDERITNTALNASDFELSNAGSVNVVSVTVGQSESTTYYSSHPSWAVLTLSETIEPDSQSGVDVTYNASSSNVIADATPNEADSIVWDNVIPAAQSISAVINPSEGTLAVHFVPAIWPTTADYSKITLKKNGTVITPVEDNGWTYANSGGDSAVFYTFAKDASGTGTYTVEAGDMIAFADSPFNAIENNADILQGITVADVSASYNSGEITITINGASLSSNSDLNTCSFILEVDGVRVLVRAEPINANGDTVTIRLNDRCAAIVEDGSHITIKHDPDAGEHEKDVYSWLVDESGAYIPAFGPVDVE